MGIDELCDGIHVKWNLDYPDTLVTEVGRIAEYEENRIDNHALIQPLN